MKRLNVVEFEKTNGYCSVEIYNGDITSINQNVDLLVVSAFKNSFVPSEGTVIGALYNTHNIDLKKLFNEEKLDLRESLNCWVTNKHNIELYKNILVAELLSYSNKSTNIKTIFKNLFISISVLEQLGTKVKSIAMPALGTGNQNLYIKEAINALISELKIFLRKETCIEKVLFIEKDEGKSLKISKSLDVTLNRIEIHLPVNDLVKNTKDEILTTIQKHGSTDFTSSDTYKLFRETIHSNNIKSIVYGISCRRLTEKLLDDIYQDNKEFKELSLFMKIKKMSELNIAKWIISYLHVIRIFGNESAHEINSDNQIPKTIGERDLSLLLFSMQRIVEFWVNNKTNTNYK